MIDRDDLGKIIRIMIQADGGCSVCVGGLLRELVEVFKLDVDETIKTTLKIIKEEDPRAYWANLHDVTEMLK